jgi:hypothetical protein
MSFVLFVLGLIAVAAGVATIGFGIPINEFSLGNTLILAGTTGLASGLVVIALAITNRQLKKIADLLITRPGGSSGRSSDVLESPGGGRMSAQRPPLPVSADMPPPARGPSYSERPLRNAPTDFADEEDDFEAPPAAEPPHPRLSGAPRNAAPSHGFDPIEDVPVSPRTQPRIPGIGTPPPSSAAEPKPAWRPPGARPAPPIDPAARQDPSRHEPSRHEPSIGIPERPARPAPDATFDSIWPADRRQERIEPQPDFAPEPAPAPAPRPNGDATHREPAAPREPVRPAGAPTPVSILKSGVVDGMAYTLYTDGSIEAELAQGVVRFGSIEELRNHLEKGA